jgi:hypothetical protein
MAAIMAACSMAPLLQHTHIHRIDAMLMGDVSSGQTLQIATALHADLLLPLDRHSRARPARQHSRAIDDRSAHCAGAGSVRVLTFSCSGGAEASACAELDSAEDVSSASLPDIASPRLVHLLVVLQGLKHLEVCDMPFKGRAVQALLPALRRLPPAAPRLHWHACRP